MKKSPVSNQFWLRVLLINILVCVGLARPAYSTPASGPVQVFEQDVPVADTITIAIPLVYKPLILPKAPRTNAPYFDGNISLARSAVFWFGQVGITQNYADVRVGYNTSELFVHLNVFDRLIWFDDSPSPEDLTAWDGVSLYLNLSGNTGDLPTASAYRFDGQVRWWRDPALYQASYQGNGANWQPINLPFTVDGGWVSETLPNNTTDDLGWSVAFHIPFSSLGLTELPSSGTIWGLALALHDRDNAAGSPIPDQLWPSGVLTQSPVTWGQIRFGLPVFNPPTISPAGTTTVRHLLDGKVVKDSMVGGGFDCGGSLNRWNQWGIMNYAHTTQMNVQNQAQLGDWPCFSKIYLTFPMSSIPPAKTIISATLTLHHFGNSDPSQAASSLIQVLTVDSDWDESSLNWNNAPLAVENVSQAWVEALPGYPGYPGIPREWDLSRAVTQAYQAGLPLRLAMYSADYPMHSGKYFYSSDMDDYAAITRPTLTVVWGD
ncbi:MAG TPA: DNRLRE domain-containing protein [Anaerolineales bacterium]|nr:DNRLRE domain-containing protein [Anaerolineales bacterium]